MKLLSSSAFYPQTDGQTEVKNRSLKNLMHCLAWDHKASWDLILLHIEFAFNNYVNKSTGCTPFEVVYSFRPNTPLDLHPLNVPTRSSEVALDFSKYMKNIHDDVKRQLSLNTETYAIAANA